MSIRKSAPYEFWVVAGLILMLLVPAWLTLRTVQMPRPLVPVEGNPTPLGYTWSLLLFIIPVLVIGGKLVTLRECGAEKRAFGWTLGLLIPLGIGLDVWFGMSFFTFTNKAATLGWNLPGYVWGHGFENTIPMEEFAFYGSGFIAILLTYVWSDRVWMKAYSAREPAQPRQRLIRYERWRRLMQTARRVAQRAAELFVSSPFGPAVGGAVLFGLAWLIKRNGPEPYQSGIPGYFLFLLAASVVPSALCFRIAARRINWRAFAFTLCFILLISLFWEATLGVPYQWWGYHKEQMMGIFLHAFCDLPLEAVLVWVFANWSTVLVYETVLLALQLGIKPFWKILFVSNHRLRQMIR